MGCIALVRCVLLLRCGLTGVVWYPYAGWGTAYKCIQTFKSIKYYIILYYIILYSRPPTRFGHTYGYSHIEFREVTCSVEIQVQCPLDAWHCAHYTAVICYITSVFSTLS